MKRDNQLTNLGTFVFAFGALAFLPSLFDRELLILSWLGSMQQPVGIMAMVVGGVLWGAGRLALFRDAPPSNVAPPTWFEPSDAPTGTAAAGPSAPAPAPTPTVQPNVLSGQVEPSQRR